MPKTAADDRRARAPRRGDRPRRGRPLLREPVVRVGPVPERARLGHRPRGLLRGRRRLGLLPARPRPLPRVPLERGRHGRDLGHPPRALPRARALERAGPDPEGADVRPHRAAGQPRRGRQGVLVVPRRACRATRCCTGATTTRRARSRTSSSCTTAAGSSDPELELLDTGVVRRRPVLVGRRHLREGLADRGAGADRRREPRAGRGDAGGAADALVPQHVVLGRRGGAAADRAATARRSSSPTTRSPATGSRPRPAPTARSPRRSSARTRRTRPASSARRRRRRTRRTASTTTSSRAPPPSTRTASARRRRCGTA